jgi:uncharacterized membrane protein YkvA (DUF1232 family)
VIWRILIGLAAGLLAAWLALIAVLLVARPKGGVARESVRILPDVLRLIRRLATDRTVPRRTRVLLWLALAYLATPIDLVPDFIPVVGYADDVILVGAVLRAAVRGAGPGAVRRHWPGTPAGLQAVWRLARLPGDADSPDDATRAPDGPSADGRSA